MLGPENRALLLHPHEGPSQFTVGTDLVTPYCPSVPHGSSPCQFKAGMPFRKGFSEPGDSRRAFKMCHGDLGRKHHTTVTFLSSGWGLGGGWWGVGRRTQTPKVELWPHLNPIIRGSPPASLGLASRLPSPGCCAAKETGQGGRKLQTELKTRF